MRYKKQINPIICFLAATCLFWLPSISQAQIKNPSWEVSFSGLISDGEQAPFWLISNRQGKYLPENNAGSIEMGFFAEADTGKVFDYHFGMEAYGRQDRSGDLWIHQLYGGITLYDLLQLRAGMWEEIVGSREPKLSSGSIIWSGNARPIPKIEISTPGYMDVPYTRGYAEIKGMLSHGWFEEGRFASDVYMHHKNAYIRLGGDLPVNISYGFNHYAQWGGSTELHDKPYPSDLEAYYWIFFNRSADPDDPAAPDTWARHKYGNTLGSRNYGIDLDLESVSAGIYFQDVFEDGSGLRRRNFPDGLWGAYVRFPEKDRLVQGVVYEFLHTKDQSGPRHSDDEGNIIGGNDNYFNHAIYRSGWSYHDYTIGSPLISSPLLTEETEHYNNMKNNRVSAHHIGLEGFIAPELNYRGLFTYSRNYGTFNEPFDEPIDQLSLMVELTRPLPWYELEAGITLAGDIGRMYGDNYGVMLNLRKRGVW